MFRNPGQNSTSSTSAQMPLAPSVGRPPTPPNETRSYQRRKMKTQSSTNNLPPKRSSKIDIMPTIMQSAKKMVSAKPSSKANASILSFFKKVEVDSPVTDDSMFLSQSSNVAERPPLPECPVQNFFNLLPENSYGNDEYFDKLRLNESIGPIKRRKILNISTMIEGNEFGDKTAEKLYGAESNGLALEFGHSDSSAAPAASKESKLKKLQRNGPFLSDSDTDDENENESEQMFPAEFGDKESTAPRSKQLEYMSGPVEMKLVTHNDLEMNISHLPNVYTNNPQEQEKEIGRSLNDSRRTTAVSGLEKEATGLDEWAGFDDVEDFQDDEFPEGEESVERKWIEEQARIEAAKGDEESSISFGNDSEQPPDEEVSSACPICNASLMGVDSDLATRHVNGCLDGNTVVIPTPSNIEPPEVKRMPSGFKSRFAQKAAVARPGQASPFELGALKSGPSSAFSKLMSGKAEDTAWATAAAAENSSRGKPAYERTCPFYKIMPGFFICVDAFRYGAIQGCRAYFLSHFHSDHYIGLTSTWCHGPIYCSKPTANLIKQQLRVDPKYVFSLEFDVKFEVPNTEGVVVTMIPANHCPGSSLFLYEKTMAGKVSPRTQRILHCGDFRACPAHITHPLLMPDLVDSITGKTQQQKIDVCYLDTTYLNPRYAFPSQEQVIQACANMCVSLKSERAEGMAKFVNSATLKAEDHSITMSLTNAKRCGRLLIVCGTYSIGKERICLGIARALDCKIYAPPGKMRICAALEDEELMNRMTKDPKEAQIHMQMLMEIRPETLQEYLNNYKPHFSRVVGFRPTGWNYKPPISRVTQTATISQILTSPSWRSSFSLSDLVPQRGSTREASCFGVPYSEHSSFRELTLFVCALRIEKIIPTVNVGSAPGRAKMKVWIEKWLAERRKNGIVKIGVGKDEVQW